MEFSLFVISKEEIDEATIMDFEREKVFIRPFMDENIEVEMTGHFYYEISNESSSSSNVNPYNRIEEVHDVLKTIYELGSFKLILLDEEKNIQDLLEQEDGNIEKAFASLPQEKISMDTLLERYPHMIDTNRMYIID
ncbi:MAG TPA: hypothetical protein DGK91_14850 [Clostridium sp.]|jgi:hypothetical protein|nr:hypothetical protein [Clostridia bacterium]HCW05674.1 hypothetical protein [Clostridium sp.]